MDLAYPLAGFVVGAVVGLTGVGGGALMTPLLIGGFGVPALTAVGTDLLFAGLTKSGGAVAHGRQGHVDWRAARWLAAGSLPATVLALLALAWLPPAGPAARLTVTTVLGAMLILTALALFFRAPLLARARAADDAGPQRKAFAVVTGAFIGLAVTFSSVGAGAVGATALVLLFPALTAQRIVGTDIAHAVPLSLLAGLGHVILGHVDWELLALLLSGSLPGILAGSRLAARLPERLARRGLAALLLLAGGKLVIA